MICDICKENEELKLEKIKGKFVQICDFCMGDFEHQWDNEREERKIKESNE